MNFCLKQKNNRLKNRHLSKYITELSHLKFILFLRFKFAIHQIAYSTCIVPLLVSRVVFGNWQLYAKKCCVLNVRYELKLVNILAIDCRQMDPCTVGEAGLKTTTFMQSSVVLTQIRNTLWSANIHLFNIVFFSSVYWCRVSPLSGNTATLINH